MKTLAVLAVILGVLFLCFIVKAEKSFVIKGNEVVPSGIDIPKLINTHMLSSDIISDSGPVFINKIKTDVEKLVSKTVDKISESIKSPIENKINEVLCPTK